MAWECRREGFEPLRPSCRLWRRSTGLYRSSLSRCRPVPLAAVSLAELIDALEGFEAGAPDAAPALLPVPWRLIRFTLAS